MEVTTRGPPQVSFYKMPDLELKRCLHDVYRFSVMQLIAHENMIQLLKKASFCMYISVCDSGQNLTTYIKFRNFSSKGNEKTLQCGMYVK